MNNTKDFKQYLKTSSTKTFKIMANMKEVKENNVKLTNSNRINNIRYYKRRSRCTLSY